MKKNYHLPVFVALFFLPVAIHAQPNKKPVTKQPIKDSFALTILTTIDQLLRFAEDPKKTAMSVAGELQKTNTNGAGIYNSPVRFPGFGNATLMLSSTSRKINLSTWEWQGMIYQFPKGQQTALLKQTEAKLDTLIKSFDARKTNSLSNFYITVRNWSDKSWLEKDELSVLVTFNKKVTNTEQSAIDSILQLYRPLLSSPATAKTCVSQFAEALALEGVERPKVKEIFINELKSVANTNTQAAFNMLLSGPSYIDVKEATAQLTSSQQDQLKRMANQYIDDFNKKYNNVPTTDVVVEKKKELEKAKPPSDPCEREMWETGVKPGKYLSVNGKTAIVSDYSCTTHTYTLAVLDNGKIQFHYSVTREQVKKYPASYDYTFMLCSRCNGAGHSMEYDWYQMSTGSNFYARSDKQTKYTCGICKGSGYIKIR